MMRALQYFFGEAAASLSRGLRTALISILTIASAFFVLGAFLLLTANVERLFSRWEQAAEFSVYLRDDCTDAQRQAVERTLRESPMVAGIEAVSKDEALRRFKQSFTALSEVADELPNPLPASVEVRLDARTDPVDVEALAQRAASLPGVADVRYDRRWIQRLMTVVRVVRAGGVALAAVLVLAAALTVASVVRLALLARRDEIHIMQLVGAPIAYIRGPFVVEGLIQGGVGALLAVGLLAAAFWFARGRATAAAPGIVDPSLLSFLSAPMGAALLAGGMLVGCIGGLIAARGAREITD
jgi:cell division transport system permease protein